MEQEHLHDPLRFQYASNTRRFSMRTKMIAVVLVLIFCTIPLYEINEHTFPLNGKSTFYYFFEFSCFGYYGDYKLVNLKNEVIEQEHLYDSF